MIKWERLKDFSGFSYDALVVFNRIVLYVKEDGKEKGKVRFAVIVN